MTSKNSELSTPVSLELTAYPATPSQWSCPTLKISLSTYSRHQLKKDPCKISWVTPIVKEGDKAEKLYYLNTTRRLQAL